MPSAAPDAFTTYAAELAEAHREALKALRELLAAATDPVQRHRIATAILRARPIKPPQVESAGIRSNPSAPQGSEPRRAVNPQDGEPTPTPHDTRHHPSARTPTAPAAPATPPEPTTKTAPRREPGGAQTPRLEDARAQNAA